MAATELGSFDHLPCGLLALGGKGHILDGNRTVFELVERTRAELVGNLVDLLLDFQGRFHFYSVLYPMVRMHGRVSELAMHVTSRSGRRIDVLVSASLRPGGGQDAVIDLVLMPIAERKRLEDELLRVKHSADLSPVMIFQMAEDGQGERAFVYASEAVRRLYRLTPDGLRKSATPFFERIHADDRPRVLRGFASAAGSRVSLLEIYRVELPDEPVTWHELHAAPRPADDRVVWYGYAVDVTERLAMERQLSDQETALRTRRAISEFLSRVSHELRTPLNGILGFTRLLALDAGRGTSTDQLQKIAIIESAGESLLRLVNDVLDVTRMEGGRLEVHVEAIRLRPLLEQALRMVESQRCLAEVALARFECPASLGVRADAQRLTQVVVNLLTNAIKYNRRGGTLDVEAYAVEGEVCIEVTDTGKGLSVEQQQGLFQPFNRLGAERSQVEGTGLGLSIADNLLGLMAGRIRVNSTPGRGSTFRVYLPRDQSNAADDRPRVHESSASLASVPRDGAARSVLYVEDNAVNSALMRAMLELRPSVVLRTVTDGAHAVQEALRERPDVLLLDMHLPDTNGLELLHVLRSQPGLRDVPAIAVTAAAMREDRERAHAAGFDGYWTKPFGIAEALEELDHLLGLAPSEPAR
jgi:signal transduction histidine kinase